MTISPGTRFGPCEIVEPIGAGGMGEVYRATDTKLKRDVALKVLPRAFVEDADRLARFRREAEILASLNHSNIAQIYGLEESGDQTAIVMELVDGPTLAERIREGPIAADEAMGIALQVIAALEAAHDKGIVHRDLKPDNLKLRDDGTVKVLDFGISKPIDPTAISGGSQVSDTPAVTQTGVILGTAAYMSPEQARGKFVDQRTDIWAFGCLLFEMLTGQPAFGGEDVMLTLARVLANDTNLDSIPGSISPAVRHTIRLCLEKDPRKRIADIRDVRLALAGTFESEYLSGAAATIEPARGGRLAVAAVALVAGSALMAGAAALLESEPPARGITRFTIPIPSDQQLNLAAGRVLDLSRDGRRLLYHTTDGIYVREFDALKAVRVPGITGDIQGPVFDPDGTNISYSRMLSNADVIAERVSIYGGPATVIADASMLGPDSGLREIVTTITPTWKGTFLLSHRGGISEYDTSGDGTLTQLVELDDDSWASMAYLLPDGDTVVFALLESAVRPTSQVLLDSSLVGASITADRDGAVEPTPILSRGQMPRYIATTGHLLFLRDGVVNAVAFDPETLAIRGEVRTVLSDLSSSGGFGEYFVADNGTLAYLPAQSDADIQASGPRLGWLYTDGRFDPLAFAPPQGPGELRFPVLSPDNSRLATTVNGENDLDLYVYDLLRPGTRTLIAGSDSAEPKAVWMPDGESLIFFRAGEGLFRRAADASDREQLVLALPEGFEQTIPDWVNPDGTELVFTGIRPDGRGLYRLALTEGAEPIALLEEPGFDETTSSLSPDGRYIAYTTNESGSDEVHIRTYPDVTGRRIVVSTNGGSDPAWDQGGEYLYFLEGAVAGRQVPGSLMRVAVTTEPALQLGEPEAVSRENIAVITARPNYAHDTDADRWLVWSQRLLVDSTARDSAIVVVVENWTEWLKSEVPTD